MNTDERAEFIAALSKTADMVQLLLEQIDRLIVVSEAGRRPTDAELQQLREHQILWRGQIERIRQRLASVTIEQPTRVQ